MRACQPVSRGPAWKEALSVAPVLAVLVISLGCWGCAGDGQSGLNATSGSAGQAASATTRIGVYDSRAVAVAYAGSKAFKRAFKDSLAAYEHAKSEDDAARTAEIEAEMQSAQDQMHLQAFSTAPVDDILANIPDEIERTKTEQNLVALVSKWDEDGLAAYPEAAKIDVTPALIDAFHPNDRQRKSAEGIQKHKPIPPEEREKELEKGH